MDATHLVHVSPQEAIVSNDKNAGEPVTILTDGLPEMGPPRDGVRSGFTCNGTEASNRPVEASCSRKDTSLSSKPTT
jgi:hypothetical protein